MTIRSSFVDSYLAKIEKIDLLLVVCIEGSWFIYVSYVCLCIVVSNTYYCVVFYFLFFLCLMYPVLPVGLDCRFLIATFGFIKINVSILLIFIEIYSSNKL